MIARGERINIAVGRIHAKIAGVNKDDEIIDTTEAGRVLGVKQRQVHNLITAGLLPAQRIGRNYVIRRGDLADVPKVRKPGPKPVTKPAKSRTPRAKK